MRALTERIVVGDLEGRLPVSEQPDSFGLLCARINTMLDRIQSLVVDVRGVGDDIAHQLRTPLTRLRARLERGLRDADDTDSFQATADAALEEVDQLLGIVAALLRIRELEDHARRSRFAPVDLARLAEDACELHRPTAEDRGVDLRCVIQPVGAIDGDASLLVEAMSNLIDNAMKFGPAGGASRFRFGRRTTPRSLQSATTDPVYPLSSARWSLSDSTAADMTGRVPALASAWSRRSQTCTALPCTSPTRAARYRWSSPRARIEGELRPSQRRSNVIAS